MLYVRRNAGGISCQYCIDVLLVVEELGLRVNEKNINDVQHENELRKLGGKVQVPYLIDKTSNIAMYESIDIINHLRRTYPKKTK
jgi:glutathione S-transferase